MDTPLSWVPTWEQNAETDAPKAPEGYEYRPLGGSMYIVDRETGKRIRQTRFLVPLSGCPFDASDEYAQPGIIEARKSDDWTRRIQSCGCLKCNDWKRSLLNQPAA